MSKRWGTLEERLEHDTMPEPMSGCLLWTGCLTGKGYGIISIRNRSCSVHTVMYEAKHGPVPDGLVLRHRCDTPICVNPDHLELGTRADNIADMDKRGRRGLLVQGETHYNAKLSAADVEAIRRSREASKVLAAQYCVHRTTINRIRAGAAWKRAK